jgi:metal-responsive CopG/Arc/MetJ family transcriptional regulator
MSKNTPNDLENQSEQFIANELKPGRSEAIIEVIRKALIVGEESGWVEDFSPEEQLKLIHSTYQRKD